MIEKFDDHTERLSINLTVHNKGFLLERVLRGIFDNVVMPFELIVVLDGCIDDSKEVLTNFLFNSDKLRLLRRVKVILANNIFETASNNLAAKSSQGKYICIIQDDCVITQKGFDARMLMPFIHFDDVFAVSGNCAHNWEINPYSKGKNADGWCDLLNHTEHANKNSVPKNIFAVRDSCNRGPYMVNAQDLKSLGYFPEDIILKQDMDEHIINYCARKKLNKVCGYYGIDFISESIWGGSRDENNKQKQWSLDCQEANTKTFIDLHKDLIGIHNNENRLCE